MNNLVYLSGGKTVTDSLKVAEVFNKDHDKVMRDIRELDCSRDFSLANFGESTYVNDRGRTYPKYVITQDGFSFLVMGYTGAEASRYKELYISEFNRMRDTLNNQIDLTRLSPEMQMFKMTFDAVAKIQIEAAEANQKIIEVQTKVTTIQETILQRDDNWRQKITGMLNGAAQRFGGHQEIRKESYSRLEERAHCKLNTRLANLKDRLEESGATKTKIEKANRLDVIEADPKLKEIYSTIVKELSIGALL